MSAPARSTFGPAEKLAEAEGRLERPSGPDLRPQCPPRLERAVREEMERASRFRSEKERLEREIEALSRSPGRSPIEDLREKRRLPRKRHKAPKNR